MTESRDPDRRRASKRAFYARNKERLRAKARERAATRREDSDVRETQRRAAISYRVANAEKLRFLRLNRYRKAFIENRGLDAFMEEFRGRAKLPHGSLLEDLNAMQLATVLGAAVFNQPSS